jgi:Sugar (and other) transporter
MNTLFSPPRLAAEIRRITAEERSDRAAAVAGGGQWRDLLSSENDIAYRTAIGVAVMALQQLTGINAIS